MVSRTKVHGSTLWLENKYDYHRLASTILALWALQIALRWAISSHRSDVCMGPANPRRARTIRSAPEVFDVAPHPEDGVAREIVHVDSKAIEAEFARISRATRGRWIQQSVNWAAVKTAVEVNRRVRDELALKGKRVRKAISVRRGFGGAIAAAVTIRGQGVPLVEYKAKQTRRGVTVKVKKRGARKRLPKHFLAQMRSGHVGVFSRTTSKRLPIKEKFGPDVFNIVDDAAELAYITGFGQRILWSEMNRRLAVILKE